MQPITLPIAELKPALVGLGKVIAHKATLPFLKCLKIERTAEGWIALTSTNLDSFITMRLEQPAEGPPLALLVPYEQLSHLVKSCAKNETIHIAPGPDPETTLISFALDKQFGESRAKVPAVSEFPQIPKIKGEPIPLPPELRKSIHEAMECSSDDPTRFILNGAFIDTSKAKAHYVVGTDGRQLYSSNSFSLSLKDSIIILRNKFLGWREFNVDGEWQLKVSDKAEEHLWVQLSSRRYRFITRQPEGTYPNWRQVVPDTASNTQIILDPESLEGVQQMITRLPEHDTQYHTIGIEFDGSAVCLLAKEAESDKWIKAPLTRSKAKGKPVAVFCDRNRLARALRFGLNTIELVDEISPLRFINAGKTLIVMPVRASGPSTPPTSPKPAPVAAIPVPRQPEAQRPPRPMQIQPPHPQPPAPQNPSAVEEAIQMTLQLRDVFQDGADKLKALHSHLRQLQREQKTNAKQFGSLRSTLQSLQAVRL